MYRFIILSLCILLLSACQSPTSQAPQPTTLQPTATPAVAQMNQPFQLGGGQQISLPDPNLQIKFESVLEDSRCPRSELCVQAGSARVALLITLASGESAQVELSTAPNQETASFDNYTIQLQNVEPYPQIN